MAEKNATGASENLDHQGKQPDDPDKKGMADENTKTTIKNAHASGLGSLGRSEENSLPQPDQAQDKKGSAY